MKFYLAGAYERKDELRAYGRELKEMSHEVTSSWLWASKADADIPDEVKLEWARKNLSDLMDARGGLIIFTEKAQLTNLGPFLLGRGGRAFEAGFAVALGIKFFVIGPRENVFMWLAAGQFDTWEDFLEKHLGQSSREEVEA